MASISYPINVTVTTNSTASPNYVTNTSGWNLLGSGNIQATNITTSNLAGSVSYYFNPLVTRGVDDEGAFIQIGPEKIRVNEGDRFQMECFMRDGEIFIELIIVPDEKWALVEASLKELTKGS